MSVARWIIRVLERMLAIANDVQKALTVHLVGILLRIVVPYPLRELRSDQLLVGSNGTPVREVVLLSIDEGHLLRAGNALVAQSIVYLRGDGSVAAATYVQACG